MIIRDLPSFYCIEIHGDVADGIIGPNLGIEVLEIGSKDFDNDMLALQSLSSALDNIDVNIESEQTDLNPEFYGDGLLSLPLTDKQRKELMDAELKAQQLNESGTAAAVLTYFFDEWGDYVSLRKTIKCENGLIVARVAAHPNEYAANKNNNVVRNKRVN